MAKVDSHRTISGEYAKGWIVEKMADRKRTGSFPLRVAAYLLPMLPIILGALSCTPYAAFASTDVFAVVTDTHIGTTPENDANTIAAMNRASQMKGISAFINCGDVTNLGVEEEYWRYLYMYNQSGLEVPMIQTIGNHDNAVGGNPKWLEPGGYVGYDADTGVDFFVNILNGGELNTVHHFKNSDVITIGQGCKQKGGIYPKDMLKWLDKQLKKTIRKGKVAVVVSHYAPWHTLNKQGSEPANIEEMFGICQSYPNVIYLCGHGHTYGKELRYQSYIYDKAETTSYKREGVDTSKVKYPVNLCCLNAVSRISGFFGTEMKSERNSNFYVLAIDDKGKATLVEEDLTHEKITEEIDFPIETSDIVLSFEDVPKGTISHVSVSFSDGKSYSFSDGLPYLGRGGDRVVLRRVPKGVLATAVCDNPLVVPENDGKIEAGSGEPLKFSYNLDKSSLEKLRDLVRKTIITIMTPE